MEISKIRLAEIFNSEFETTNFGIPIEKVLPEDILLENFWDIKNVIQFEKTKNPINKLFKQLTKNRYKDYGQFHHFKKFEFALNIIKNRSVQVSSLFSNDANDFAEYTELFKRLGMFHPLLSKDFQKKAWENNIDPNDETPSDSDRRHIFVMCFTQDNHNEKFWKNYANNDHGVAIGFRISDYQEEARKLYDFRDVFYDTGYSFDFFNAINYKIRKEFNKIIFAEGLIMFSKFYKRAKYNWENETRLCFHYDDPKIPGIPTSKFLETHFPIQEAAGIDRTFIELPLEGTEKENPLFKISITEVACGKFVSADEFMELKQALSVSYPTAFIWQRQ